jgi:hypothetical protein
MKGNERLYERQIIESLVIFSNPQYGLWFFHNIFIAGRYPWASSSNVRAVPPIRK